MPKLSHRIEYAGLSLTRLFFEQFSLDRGTALAAAMARPLVPLFRERAMRNLRLALPDLPELEHRRIVSGMADHFVRTGIEYLHIEELRDTPDRISLQGVEHLHAAHDAGRGALLITGHFGNWEAARIACARVGYPPALIYRRFNNAAVDAEGQKRMEVLGAPLFHKGRRGTLGLLRHIRKGGTAMILCDQRFRGAPGIPFFGKEASTALAPAEIALEYGAALLPVRGIRQGQASRFDVTIDPPLDTTRPGLSAMEIMGEVNARLEGWIRHDPEQYFWLHNRWGKNAGQQPQ